MRGALRSAAEMRCISCFAIEALLTLVSVSVRMPIDTGINMNNMIVCDPDIMMGKPVITGTRITVELILEKLALNKKELDENRFLLTVC